MKSWTLSHLQSLKDKGKIRGYSCEPEAKKSKRAKYGNEKVEWDGIVFDSKHEYKEYRKLLLRLKAGEIGQLERQVPYVLIEKSEGQRECKYIADFRYVETGTGQVVIADAKGMKTDVYKLKKKLMKQKYNIEILEL